MMMRHTRFQKAAVSREPWAMSQSQVVGNTFWLIAHRSSLTAHRFVSFLPITLLILTLAQPEIHAVELTVLQERWAILIGVGAYPLESKIPPLKSPKEDVNQFKETLVLRGGFDAEHVITLTDDKATHDQLETSLDYIRANLRSETSLVLFYFSGRGVRVPSGLYIDVEQDGFNECLLLHDAVRGVTESYLRDAELGQLLQAVGAAQTVVIIDACYSSGDQSTKALTLPKRLTPAGVWDGIHNEFMPRGSIILEATKPNGHTLDGVFTSRLIDILNDKMTYGADGIVQLQEVASAFQERWRNQYNEDGLVRAVLSIIQPYARVESEPPGAEVVVIEPVARVDPSSAPTTPVAISLPIGVYTCELRRWGYQKQTFQIEFAAPGETKLAPVLLKPTAIRGRLVFERTGKPIANATVRLTPLSYKVKTDADGRFSFDDWATHELRHEEVYRIEVIDKRVSRQIIDVHLDSAFHQDVDVPLTELAKLPPTGPSGLFLFFTAVIALSGIGGFMRWFWTIRPNRIEAYRIQHYRLWKEATTKELREYGRARLEAIPRKHRDYFRTRYLEEQMSTSVMAELGGLSYPERIANRIAGFSSAWTTARQNLTGRTSEQQLAFRKAIREITELVCLACGFEKQVAESEFDHLHGHLVSVTTLPLRLPVTAPFIYIQRGAPTDKDLASLIEVMREFEVIRRFAFVIVFSDAKRIQEKLIDKGLRPSFDYIVMDEHDLRDILIAEDSRSQITDTILSQAELTVVAPYVEDGPAPSNVFFGREWEIKTILDALPNRISVALIGGRRIGKTSILHRVRDILLKGHRSESASIEKFTPLYLTCQAARDHDEFLRHVASQLHTQWHVNVTLGSLTAFFEYVSKKREESQTRIAVLVDETDAVLKYDLSHENQLFRMFRALSETETCSFVFTGERVVHQALINPNLPLFNFCQRLRIGYLEEKDAELLITNPMRLINLQFDDEPRIVQRIIRLTSRHPRMVQWLCSRLIELINRESRRLITQSHLDTVENSSEFQNTFIQTILGQRSALEELICLLVVEADGPVPASDITKMLQADGLPVSEAAIETALNILEFTSVLIEETGHYSFVAREFPSIYRRNRKTKVSIGRIKEKLRHELSQGVRNDGAHH